MCPSRPLLPWLDCRMHPASGQCPSFWLSIHKRTPASWTTFICGHFINNSGNATHRLGPGVITNLRTLSRSAEANQGPIASRSPRRPGVLVLLCFRMLPRPMIPARQPRPQPWPPADTAWLPRSCSSYDMSAASMQYDVRTNGAAVAEALPDPRVRRSPVPISQPAVRANSMNAASTSYRPAIQQSSDPAIQQSSNPLTQRPGNPAIQQSGNPAIKQPGNTALRSHAMNGTRATRPRHRRCGRS